MGQKYIILTLRNISRHFFFLIEVIVFICVYRDFFLSTVTYICQKYTYICKKKSSIHLSIINIYIYISIWSMLEFLVKSIEQSIKWVRGYRYWHIWLVLTNYNVKFDWFRNPYLGCKYGCSSILLIVWINVLTLIDGCQSCHRFMSKPTIYLSKIIDCRFTAHLWIGTTSG